MQGRFLFLGTGASAGIPLIGCACAVCKSSSPKNKRLRPSGLLFFADKTLLIDIGPDFRQQMLMHQISHLDGLLLTHTHYDHLAGIDELRIMNVRQKRDFPCLLSKESMEELNVRYYYLFQEKKEGSANKVQLDCRVLPSDAGSIEFEGIAVRYFSYFQGNMKVNGFRIGSFAYVSDIREFDEQIYEYLQGVEQLVLSALKPGLSHAHLSLEEAVAFADRIQAKQTWLTHLSHHVDHETACRMLPAHVQPGFDGLEFRFEVPSHA